MGNGHKVFTQLLMVSALAAAVSAQADTGSKAKSPQDSTYLQTATAVTSQPVAQQQFVDLKGGGVVWVSEDPALAQPVLNFSVASVTALSANKIDPINLSIYTNYAAFVERIEVLVYEGRDTDLISPIAQESISPASIINLQLSVDGARLKNPKIGDDLRIVVKAYDASGNFDQTFSQTIRLVNPEDREKQLSSMRFEADSQFREFSGEELELRSLEAQSLTQQQQLRYQNIVVRGSRVRVQGQDIPRNSSLAINDENVPVTQEGNFSVDYLLPIGTHRFDIRVRNHEQETMQRLVADITGRYLFLVALADITASKNRVTGSVEPLQDDDRYTDTLVEGRLAFYLKGKIKGKYLITAHADTDELPFGDMFDGFFKENPQDIFRRLDPDAYYPVYGDDSTTIRDVDTQGKLYVRVDWDKNEAVLGNYYTGITGTRYGTYSRSLYGGALNWRSNSANTWGDAKTQVRVFAAEAQTAYGHSEFLGTGGSLYYLKHTDVLPGSERIVLEVRDSISGNVATRVELIPGVDYEIDEIQGRIILSRPLMQTAQQSGISISRQSLLGEHYNLLLVDYEYHSRGIMDDDATGGGRVRHWVGDHFAIGTTYVRENRDIQDYEIKGVDAHFQAGRGTYLTLEKTQSEASATSIFYSDNGGLKFNKRILPTQREGDAISVDARVNFQELGITQNAVTASAWHRDMDDGFSVSRFDYGASLEETGAELSAEIVPGIFINARYTEASRDAASLDEALAQLDARLSSKSRLVVEAKRYDEQYGLEKSEATLAALRYQYRFSPAFEAYIQGQLTVDESENYAKNDLVTLGANYSFSNLSSVTGEVSDGSRGSAYRVAGEYRLSNDHTVYAAYAWSTDTTTTYDPILYSNPDGFTLGQRWRVSSTTNLFNESQWLKGRDEQGIAHTYGMDFYPTQNWNYGFTLQKGSLDSSSGEVERRAYSLRGGYSAQEGSWRSAFEWRDDSGAESREQWLSTNSLSYKVNQDLRVAGRVNISRTTDEYQPDAMARFNEANIGFAYRPADGSDWAVLGKYTYLYDLSTLEQDTSMSWYDQKSHIISLEGIYTWNAKWSTAAKFADRRGSVREGRGEGAWFDSDTLFAAAQLRYALAYKWNALAEYRWLDVEYSGNRKGWLVGVDRNISDNFRIGAGYNFTDFSDDLRRHDYEYEGWFLNLVGYY